MIARALRTLAALCLAATAAQAEICLQSKVTGAQITGDLVRFTGQRWDISTPLGRQSFYIDDFFPCAAETAAAALPPAAPMPVEPDPPAPPPPADRLSIAGSNTVGAALMPAVVAAYFGAAGDAPRTTPLPRGTEIAGDGTVVRIEAQGTATGFAALEAGTAEIAMASRPVGEDEAQRLAAAGVRGLDGPDRSHVLALDGVVAIVSRQTPISAIGLEDLTRIFSGDVREWRELGLPNGPIRVLARDAASGTWESFERSVLAGRPLVASAERFHSNADLAAAVAADPAAIGFVAAGVTGDARPLALRGRCGIVQRPDLFSIRTEDYALSRRLYLYTARAERTGLLADVVDFAVSEAAQPAIDAAGFVSRAISEMPGADDLGRRAVLADTPEESALAAAAELSALMSSARRLSVTFRFATGSTALDVKALQDGPMLARYLGEHPGEVLLLGFADARGPFEANRALSAARAAEAAALLIANGVAPGRIRTFGFSELLPVFCNDDPRGRARNRRVEVWLR